MFIYFSLYVPYHVFGAHTTNDALFKQGVQYVSWAYALMNLVCFLFSPLIGKLCAMSSKKAVHTLSLLLMGSGLISMFFMHDITQVMIAMACVGVGWATTLSLPFALLSEHVPSGKEGILMGTFNVFIAAPGVLSSILVGSLVEYYDKNYALAMIIGGVAMVISAIILQFVREGVSKANVHIPSGH
jgi:maltose/moltooligosaccharide transporter